jgi:hypothetical protein
MARIFFAWLSLTFFFAGISHAAVADRIVVSVDGSPYSQRYVMAYFVARESMQEIPVSTKGAPPRQPFAEELAVNWKSSLAKFAADMVIRQESSRLGSFLTTPKILVKGVERANARLAADKDLATAAASIGLGDDELGHFVGAVLQVEGFRKSRDRQAAGASQTAGGSWQDALMERALIRYFEGGDVWQPLSFPNRGAAVVKPANGG